MKHKSESFPFIKGDYLELKYDGMEQLYSRVTGIDIHQYFVGMSKIHMKLLANKPLGKAGLISWDFEYLQHLLIRVIKSPTEKRLIRLLYD